MTNKAELRKHFCDLRDNIPDIQCVLAAMSAAKIFLDNVQIGSNDVVAAYCPIRNELSPTPLLEQLHKINVKTALPFMENDSKCLKFSLWYPSEFLERNENFDIYEPADKTRIISPNVIVAPLVACTMKGTRLGYGGGYYDATLELLRKENADIITIGYAYDEQITDVIPEEEHDQNLDYIVTNTKFIKTKS